MPKIICVSKTFSIDKLNPLIKHGHHHFGENKVQEAIIKWSNLKKTNANLKLHMVGRLQTNKTKRALGLFDFIHSLDSMKLADILKKYEQALNKKLSFQVGIKIEFQEIEGANHFFSNKKKELSFVLDKYIKKESALY